MVKVLFKKVSPDAKLPVRAHDTDGGMDLFSAENVVIAAGERRMVSTGLKIGIVPNGVQVNYIVPDNIFQIMAEEGNNISRFFDYPTTETFVWQAEVTPRSGMAVKSGVHVLNSPGKIDNGYRGILMVILQNHCVQPFEIKVGDKIAQLTFTKSYILPVEEVQEFPDETARGEGGFGSSDKK